MMFDSREDLYLQGSQWLAKQPGWGPLIMAIGPCRHEAKPEREPYEAMIRAVAYQQLTAKAGDAILHRLRGFFRPTPPHFHRLNSWWMRTVQSFVLAVFLPARLRR